MQQLKLFLVAFISSVFFIPVCSAQNGIITSVAGTTTVANSGDGGPALSAAINGAGMAVDKWGNIYIACNGDNIIRKVTAATGIITTICGTQGVQGYTGDGGPASAALIGAPNGIAVDTAGNLYIPDVANYVVRKINTAGIISTFAGIGTSAHTGDGGPATAAEFERPLYVHCDKLGNVYVADYNQIRKINTAGIISTIAGNGVNGFSGDGGPATAAMIDVPHGMATDAAGNFYFSDWRNYRIRKISTAGIITTVIGNGGTGAVIGDNGPATAISIDAMQVTTDLTGNVYFADDIRYRVRKVNSAGIITTVAGNGSTAISGDGGPATAAGIGMSQFINFDDAQNLYILSGYRVRKVSFTPDIVSDSFSVYLSKLCSGLQISVTANSTSSLNLKTSFGDGTSATVPLTGSGGSLAAGTTHTYASPGTYSVSMILLNGTTPIDSVFWEYKCVLCNTLPVNLYFDVNANCSKDNTELMNYFPVTVQVDSNNVHVDTIAATAGLYYSAYGPAGTIYSFKVITPPAGMTVSCPAGGVIKDTIQTTSSGMAAKSFGLTCATGSGFDLSEQVGTRAGKHTFKGDIIIRNASCNPVNATYTARISPKYVFTSAYPSPSSVTGNVITWDLNNVSASGLQQYVHYTFDVPGAFLTPGDTVNSLHTVDPVTGDNAPVDNTIKKVDTVKSSFDPNEILVSPQGGIPAGFSLEYTIHFENTGNDTAQNIYVLDTLSNYLLPGTMKILASSATMYTIPYTAGGYNIVKFDFPGIKLLDSSHHDLCDGMLRFSILTRTGLPAGTVIPNQVGIYFDDNPVVMTNRVYNTIKGLGVQEVNRLSAEIYPNPASETLTVATDKGAFNAAVITNSVGQVLLTEALTTGTATINIRNLTPGIYYIQLSGENGRITKKFVKL